MQLNDDDLIIFDKNVKLKAYVARTPLQYGMMTNQELLDGAGGYLIGDTECYANYWLFALRDVRTRKVITFEIDQHGSFNPRQLSWVLHNYTIVGFNYIKYDLQMIWLAYHYQNTENLKAASNDLIFYGMWYQELQSKYNFRTFPTKYVDLIEVCPLQGSLKTYGARLHAKRIQDLPFHHDAVLTSEEIEIVKDYCINDLDTTELLMNNLTDQLAMRADLSREYHQDLMSKSDAQIAEAVITSELKKLKQNPKKPQITSGDVYKYIPPKFISFQTKQLQEILSIITNANYSVMETGKVIIPDEVKGLTIPIGNSAYRIGNGGLHSSEKAASHKADPPGSSNDSVIIKDRDVASYYPRIVLNCGLFPKHLGEMFLKVYDTIVERRLAAKKAKRSAEADGLKITINGTFGKLGSKFSILYAPDLMIQVTITGQLALLMLIEQLELNDIEVISANTDGVVSKLRQSQVERFNQIFKLWEHQTGFVTEETEYEAVYSRDVNAYFAIKKDGKYKGKNIFYDPWGGGKEDAIWRFHKNPNTQICTEALAKLITKNIPIEKTIKECRDITRFVSVKNVKGGAHKDGYYLGKVVRWYYAKGALGAINYVSSNNKVPDSDGAKPCMDLPDEFPTDIDYDWYIKKTIKMLTALDYYKKNKQVRFF